MAEVKVSPFQEFVLAPQEQQQAKTLAPLQQMYFHNLRCMVAHTKLNLKLDPLNPLVRIQDEAYLQGKLDLLNELLNDGV